MGIQTWAWLWILQWPMDRLQCLPTVVLEPLEITDLDNHSQPRESLTESRFPVEKFQHNFIYLFKIFIFTLFFFTILYWFCHTLTWIHHGCAWVPKHDSPSHIPPHIISLDHPRAPAPNHNLGYTREDKMNNWTLIHFTPPPRRTAQGQGRPFWPVISPTGESGSVWLKTGLPKLCGTWTKRLIS